MSGKPSTPVTSPKQAGAKLSTPPPPQGDSSIPSVNLVTPGKRSTHHHRQSATHLTTPEQPKSSRKGTTPFSPSLKRSNSNANHYKSPDFKLSTVSSPYGAGLLKTPRFNEIPRYQETPGSSMTPGLKTPGGYQSDEDNDQSPIHKQKLQKTPQFFQSAKKLFQEEQGNDLKEISSQLKSRLSSAFGKLKEPEDNKLSFTELSFESTTSPTKKVRGPPELTPWTPSNSIQRLNLNLQTLQQSPLPQLNSAAMFSASLSTSHFQTYFGNEEGDEQSQVSLIKSPFEEHRSQAVSIPSPEVESSAHSALLAALTRQKKNKSDRRRNSADKNGDQKKSRRNSQDKRRNSVDLRLSAPPVLAQSLNTNGVTTPQKLPRLTTALPKSNDNEQDAVISLMALSSPRPLNFSRSHSRTNSRDSRTHSRQHSLNSISGLSPLASPIAHLPHINQAMTGKPVLPPIKGLIDGARDSAAVAAASALVSPVRSAVDNDETDVDDVSDATVDEED